MPPDDSPNKTQGYVTYYDRDGTKKLSMVLAHALAEMMGSDATEAEKALYRSVDPTSLDNLFKDQYDGTVREQGQITLRVEEYEIVVSSDGRIEITARE